MLYPVSPPVYLDNCDKSIKMIAIMRYESVGDAIWIIVNVSKAVDFKRMELNHRLVTFVYFQPTVSNYVDIFRQQHGLLTR